MARWSCSTSSARTTSTSTRTGCVLWLMLAEGATEPELVDKLTDEFDVNEPTARERR